MTRNRTLHALCLRIKASGEANRDAWFLTAEEGVVRATVFGGPKSKLRAHVAPFHQGTLWVYHDPVRDSLKVSDFDVTSWQPGLREVFERTMAADALAETILASLGSGGSFPHALEMAGITLNALDTAAEKTCPRILIHFLWNWADLLGIRPDLHHCSSCACEVPRDGVLWYDMREDALLCQDCTTGGGITIGGGARLWLSAVEDLEAPALNRISLDEVSLAQAKALVTAILTGALGKRLSTWDMV